MNPFFMTLVLVMGLAFFTHTMFQKIQLLRALESPPQLPKDRIIERITGLVSLAIGQKRLVGRRRERISGIMHALIFWGFCVLLIRSITLYGEGFVKGFQLPFLGEDYLSGYLYLLIKDFMEGIVLIMVMYAFYRRLVIRPERLHNTWEAYFVLGMIAVLMISDLIYDGVRYNLIVLFGNSGELHFFNNQTYGSEFSWTPVSVAVGGIFAGTSSGINAAIMEIMFWTHIITQLIFLNFLPVGKHFHVITALPNVFLRSIGYPHEKAKLLDLEDESVWENESLGINHIHQFNWKQGLDLYTCTECGRCKDVCPAYLTDKPLSLQQLNDSLKKELVANADNIIQRNKISRSMVLKEHEEETGNQASETEFNALASNRSLIGDVVSEETLWACTNCRACEQVCPVTIEQIPRIIAMRQGQTLMYENYPQELNTALKGLERNGNPWGIGYDKRADWAKGLGVKTMAEDSNVDYLLWVGCAGSFDERSKKVSISLVKILQKAEINFAILGIEEKCTGDFARRVGNEMMYQMVARENIETLNKYKVKKIITACPHCLNTLKHEYPQMGGFYKVVHHTQFIANLVKEGRIKLNQTLSEERLTYHDPCFLGRYNNIYETPRFLLNLISSKRIKEAERHGEESFCCGAGGGRMWMEESIGKRINVERAEEIVNLGVNQLAVACPFCLTMMEDGMKELNKDESIKTRDIVELVVEALS